MHEPRGSLGLDREALGSLTLALEAAGENLQRNLAVKARIERLIDGSHAPLTNQADDLVASDLRAWREHLDDGGRCLCIRRDTRDESAVGNGFCSGKAGR
jgi:hypothetical protein